MHKLILSADEIAEIQRIFENHPVAFSDEDERAAETLLAKLAPVVAQAGSFALGSPRPCLSRAIAMMIGRRP